MGTHIWCLIGPIFLILVKAQLHEHIPHSFIERPRSSSPSPLPSQAPSPDLIGMKEVVLFLTPDQVEVLQGSGAVLKPYPEYKPEFKELQQQFQQNILHQNVRQNIQRYQTASQNDSPKLGSRLDNYYKFLNIQQINDDLEQLRTTERTTTKIITTPQYKFTNARQNYKDKQYVTQNPNDPKTVSRTKFSSENTNSEYVRFLQNYENDSLKIIPYNALPLRQYRFDKAQAKIYTQSNEETETNAPTIAETRQNVKIPPNKEVQRNVYTKVNQKSQRNEHSQPQRNVYSRPIDNAQKSVSSKETQLNSYIQPSRESLRTEYTITNQEDQQHVYNKGVDEFQPNAYRQLNKNFRRNEQTQGNKEFQGNGYTKTVNEGQQRANNQENDEAGRNSDKIQENAYTKAIDEAHQNLKPIEETQPDSFIQPSKDSQRNEYTLTNRGDQKHVYIKAVDEVQRNAYRQLNNNFRRNKQTHVNKESQRNGYTKTVNEGQQRAYNKANDVAGRNSYKNYEIQGNVYSKAVDEAQQNLKAVEETQRIAHFTPINEDFHQNVYNLATEGAQRNAYTLESEDTQHNTNTELIEKPQSNTLRPAQLTIEDVSKNLRSTVEVPKLIENPVTVPKHFRTEYKRRFKENFKYIEGLESLVKQKNKQETPVSTPAQTPTVKQDKMSLLLAPLYQHHTVTDILARQREELINSEFKIQTRLQKLKHAPQHDHQEFTSELEKLSRSLGKQNDLAVIGAISKSPTVFINQESETEKIRPIDYGNNSFSVLSSLVRAQEPVEVNIPASYPAPFEFIRPIPVPVLLTQNDEEEKSPYPVNWNDKEPYIEQKINPVAVAHRMPFDPVTIPEHVTIIRPIWEH